MTGGDTDLRTKPVDWDAVFTSTDWRDDHKRRVVILHTNDLHSHHNGTGPLAEYTPDQMEDDVTLGGFARLATLVERERRDLRPGAELVVVDAGDFTCGSVFASLARDLSTELLLMGRMGYVGTTLGNHEMDWNPEGAAAIVDNGITEDSPLRVLASNLVFSDEDPRDDALADLMGDKLLRYRVVQLGQGLKVGLFGLLGNGALQLAPHAEPVTIRPLAEAAEEMVAQLRDEEGVDLVVCLSHSGVTEGDIVGEDETLAAKVDGIDVIVSGHTHTLMPAPVVIGETIVVQAGSYGRWLGRLVLVEEEDGFQLESWETIPVDDACPGLPDVVDSITQWEALVDQTMFQPTVYGYRDLAATTGFDLLPLELVESNLGNLVADAVRWTAGRYAGPVDVAFEANGVIREGIQQGESGEVLVGDAVRVLPLGLGPDGEMGYPIMAGYLTAYELKLAAEVTCGIAPLVSNAFFLQPSGMRFEYDPDGKIFDQVAAIYLGDEENGYDDTPLDLSPDNQDLYLVAANLYLVEMIALINELSGGLLSIELKDAAGNVVEDLDQMRVDVDSATPGVQELKLWRALPEYLLSFAPDGTSGVPRIPDRYKQVAHRIAELP